VRRKTLRGLVLASAAVLSAAVTGCGSLKVTRIAAASQRPANVAIYVDVHDPSGNAVANLEEKNFRIYEDGKLLPPTKAKRVLLEPKNVGARFVQVLVDLSGPVVDSEDLPDLAATVGKFVDALADKQEVAVSVFDGNDEVAPFLGFGASADQIPGLVDGIRKFRPRTRNTNWNGAVFQGVHTLEEKLSESTVPQKSAALVIFTDRGTDLSHSVGVETVRQKVKDSPVQIYVIAVGEKVNTPEVNIVGRNGVFTSDNLKAYKRGFDEVAKKLTADIDGRYVFSYCSPKRKGDHKAEIEIVSPAGQGKVTYKFNAAGFKSGCSPKHRPTFTVETQPPPSPPAAAKASGGDDEEEEEDSGKPEKGERPARPEKADRAEKVERPEPAEAPPPPRPAKPSGPVRQIEDKE
jgi:hypothetical protein